MCVSTDGRFPLNNFTGTASDSQNVYVMSSMSPQLYLRNIIVVSVPVSTRDKKYRGSPVASMKMGYRVWLNADAFSFKTPAVTDASRAA